MQNYLRRLRNVITNIILAKAHFKTRTEFSQNFNMLIYYCSNIRIILIFAIKKRNTFINNIQICFYEFFLPSFIKRIVNNPVGESRIKANMQIVGVLKILRRRKR